MHVKILIILPKKSIKLLPAYSFLCSFSYTHISPTIRAFMFSVYYLASFFSPTLEHYYREK